MRRNNMMRCTGLLLATGLVRLLFAADNVAPCHHCRAPDGCCYRNVISHRCVLVPDRKVIKKTVYECKEIPYCLHRLPKFGECECCPDCLACPRYKKVLVKRDIVVSEICTTKCVVEEFVEQVLEPCCHCGHHAPGDRKMPGQESPGTPPMPPPDIKSVFLPPTASVLPVDDGGPMPL
jgi:hypothetical protein